ncbi:MAG: T9SS type A sorting domain-containing protein [Chitinophagaceae bacterium]
MDSDGSLGTNLRLGVVELVNGPPNQSKSYIDGSFHAMSQSNNTQGTTMTIDQVVPLVGRFADATFPSYFHGQIAEMIMYPASHNDVDRRKIESYLAIKYGITLDEAGVSTYVNSSGGAVWSNSLFWHDVFGIGKDDGSGLNQPSSNSINTGSGDGTGQSGKGNIVLKNASSLDDGDFLMIGHDNGALTEQTNDIPNSLPGGTNGARRLGREWKVRHTGNVGTVTLEFDLTGLTVTGTVLGHFILLIDEDGNGNFNNGTVTQVPASAFGSVIFNNVTLPNNAVLALVTYNPGVILPLNLLSFDANTKNCSSLITWKTSNEVNVDRFELQVSVDNNSWYTIQTVSATNGSQDVNTYSFNYDHSAQGGNKLVRLKMVDMDGKVSYSRIISVQCGKDNIFTLYPNPAYDQVTLTGTRAGDLVMVLTMDGKRVRSQSATQGNTRIGLEGLPAGTYVIQVAREGLLMPAGNMVKQ